MQRLKKRRISTAIAAAMGASFAMSLAVGNALAQQSAQARERIEVTGTNIKRTDTETPAPVQIITREQIERSGATSVAELLRNVPAIAGGSLQDFNGGSGFNSGNQTASLRGLGSVATLVLLNGRRVAPAPTADPNLGQGTGFNLNTIPLSAIERIEVLKDGASAVYGSDAIAGVINIILRKDYRGGDVQFNHWQNEDGRYRINQLSGSVGFGDLGRDRYNFLVAAEYLKRSPTSLVDSGSGVRNDAYQILTGRNTAASALSYPPNARRESAPGSGVFLASGRLPVDPRCPPELRVSVTATIQECRFNNFDYLNIQSPLERKGVMGRATFQLGANTTAFVEAGFSRTDSIFTSQPPSLDAAAPVTWFNRDGNRFSYTLILPIGHPDNPNNFRIGLRYRFADIGGTTDTIQTDATRAVAGLNGTWGGWDWESALLYSSSKRKEEDNRILYFPAVQAAVNNATYRFFGSNSQALLDSLHPVISNSGESKISSWDIKASRELAQWRNGPVGLATGFEVRREQMDIVSDPRVVAGDFIGLASSTVSGSRNVESLYAELSVPILKSVETSLAARYDHYSDFGGSFTPKVGFKWNATDSLAARGTWGRGFRAPSLFQISNANVQAFNAGIVDPVRCPGGQQAPGAEAEDCNRTISTLIQANTNLQPEKSTSHTYGLIWSPDNNFSASADVWYVHRTNFIDRFSSTVVIQNEFNPNFTGGVVLRNPNPATWLPGIPNSGPILSTIRRFDNFGDTAVRGVDLDVIYKKPLGEWGKLTMDASGTYYDKMLWQLGKGVPYVSGVGNFYVFEAPRWKGQATLVWDIRDLSFLGRYNYVGKWYYGDPVTTGGADGGTCYLSATSATRAYLGECFVSAWETYDLGVAYKGIRNLTVGFQVLNVFDKAAPYDPNQTTLGFNPTFHNPYGRYFQASISYKFK